MNDLTQTRVVKLKEYLLNTFPEGKFKAKSNDFIDVLQINSMNTHYINLLIEYGFLRRTKEAVQVNKKWESAEYEIIEILNKSNEIQEDLNKDNTKIYIEENFNNMAVRLIKTEKGYAMSIVDIAKALHTSWDTINEIIKRNNELFEEFIVLPSNVTLDNRKSLTKDGVIGLLMKISYQRLTPEKQKLVLDFQKWAIKNLGILISDGAVKLTEQEHAKVQTNTGNIIDMSNTEVDLLFNQFETDFNKFFESSKIMVKTAEERRIIAERKAEDLKNQNQKWITKTQLMMDKMHSMNMM